MGTESPGSGIGQVGRVLDELQAHPGSYTGAIHRPFISAV
jgi:hypothetical protein